MWFKHIIPNPRRLRNRRGFGVHSPLAFRLIKEVVLPSPEIGYYGYHDIDLCLEEGQIKGREFKKLRERSRLLLRLCSVLGIKYVSVPGTEDVEAYRAGLQAAGVVVGCDKAESATSIIEKGDIKIGRMVLVANGKDANWLNDFGYSCLEQRHPCCVVAFDPSGECVDFLYSRLKRGLILEGKDYLICIFFDGMHRQHYLV